MNSKTVTLEVPLALNELVGKLKEISVEDFDMIRDTPQAVYYGEVTSHSFNIKHVRYGPMSHAPSLEGDITEGVNNKTIVKVKMDIKESYLMVRKTYYGVLLPIGVILMLLSLLIMGGTDLQWQSLFLSSSFIIVAILVVNLQKAALISIKKKEFNAFISILDSQVVADAEDAAEELNPSAVLENINHIKIID